MKFCYRCGWNWPREEPPGFRDVCPQCQAYLHCCTNCSNWDADHTRCTHPTAEPARDSEAHNFCEFFNFAFRAGRRETTDAVSREAEARRKWESLFKE